MFMFTNSRFGLDQTPALVALDRVPVGPLSAMSDRL